MPKKYHRIRLDGQEYRLRLTFGAQARLREEFDRAPLDIVLSAAGDERMLCAVLSEALSWEGSGNPVTDGETFCDLLVDNGYAGQEAWSALVMDVAAASGILTADNAGKLKASVNRMLNKAYRGVFAKLDSEAEDTEEDAEPDNGDAQPETVENPTTAPDA